MDTDEHGEVNDLFDLARFVAAQEESFEVALGEFRCGYKALNPGKMAPNGTARNDTAGRPRASAPVKRFYTNCTN
jgi:hypothetical protein